ncbi:MAG: addiction module protein [Planctomycetota bacterium]|nr:addiction module protein [Planctomycetota bacterium]
MAGTLPLGKMTVEDKLRAMEELWDDLLRTAEEIPSPSWHRDVLRAREARQRGGASRFVDWPEAKRRIRERTR